MPGLMCEFMTKQLMPLTDPHVPLTYIQLSTHGTTTDCPGAKQCPDLGLGEDPPGHRD